MRWNPRRSEASGRFVMLSRHHWPTLFRVAFLAALIGVFVLALLPAPETPRIVSWQDKIEHAVLFFGLMLLGAAAWPGRAVAVAGALLGYGVAMEFAQSLTEHRFGDVGDWVADALGVAVALLVLAGRRSLKVAGRN